jgi:ATP-GRASP peptide maturase of grasp-with-spasm system
MILIFSVETDKSTSDVIDWLIYYQKDVLRINNIENIDILHLDINTSSYTLQYNGKIFTNIEVEGVWYRRGLFSYQVKDFSTDQTINKSLNKLLNAEHEVAINYLIYLIEKTSKKKLGSYFSSSFNKLFQLDKAQEAGFQVPKTILAKENHSPSYPQITKSLDTVFEFLDNGFYLMNYTNKVEATDHKMGLSYFQQLQQKIFEIRTFYLDGKCFSMAIFSQKNDKTKIDFRHYDKKKPNRNVPFNLPKEIEIKIGIFMKSIDLNTGSIDLIYTKNKEFIFLEVNPIGQFGMTSIPCNYCLEKEIAKYLISDGKEF